MAVQLGITNAQADSSQGWIEKSLTPDTAQAFLEVTLHGEKHVTITGVIADTRYKDVNLGTSCRSDSTGTVEGQVNDSGDVTGSVKTTGTTHCSQTHNYFYSSRPIGIMTSNRVYNPLRLGVQNGNPAEGPKLLAYERMCHWRHLYD